MTSFIEILTLNKDSVENIPNRKEPYRFIVVEFTNGEESLIVEIDPKGTIDLRRAKNPVEDLILAAGEIGHASGMVDGETGDYTKRFGPPKFALEYIKYSSVENLYKEVTSSGEITKLSSLARIRLEHLLNPEQNR